MKPGSSEKTRGAQRAMRGTAIGQGPSILAEPPRLLSWARAGKTGQNRARPDTPKGPKRSFRPRQSRAKAPIPADMIWRKAPQDNQLTALAWAGSPSRPKGIKDKKS